MKILGIETSCDETGVAIFCEKEGIIENKVYSQVDLHRKYGGVIPELASRDHIRKTLPLIKSIFEEHQLGKQDIRWDRLYSGARTCWRALSRGLSR